MMRAASQRSMYGLTVFHLLCRKLLDGSAACLPALNCCPWEVATMARALRSVAVHLFDNVLCRKLLGDFTAVLSDANFSRREVATAV